MPVVKICPSLMCADFSNLEKEISRLQSAGADVFHIDVMDGRYVPNFAMGLEDIKAVKRLSSIPVDVHLMIEEPEQHIKLFTGLGCDIIYVHMEATRHIHKVVHEIKNSGMKAGVVLNPGTYLEVVNEILSDVDFVMLMAVNPGFAGQSFIPETVDKVFRLKEKINKTRRDTKIAIDGCINTHTVPLLHEAGAEYFIAGTAGLFKKPYDYAGNIRALKGSVCYTVKGDMNYYAKEIDQCI